MILDSGLLFLATLYRYSLDGSKAHIKDILLLISNCDCPFQTSAFISLFRNIAAFMPLIFSLFTSLGVVFLFFHVTADLIILHISNMRQSFEDNRMRCVSKHPLFEVGLCIHYTHFFRRGEYRMTTVDNSHTISSEKIYILWMHRPTSNSGGLETQRIFSSCDRH